jgi:hypothetical protein
VATGSRPPRRRRPPRLRSSKPVALFTRDRRRYGAVVLPLGFRFEVDAVLVGGVAHRRDCDRLPRPLPPDAVSVSAAGVHRADRCPRECPQCRPPFETMLSYQLERSVEALVP